MPMVLLSVESENGTLLTYRLTKAQITVGASSRNDVVVRAPGLAERHLVIHRNGDVFTFVTSTRQTVVLNGERRSRGVLNPGDKLRLGTATLIFRGGADDIVLEEVIQAGETAQPGAADQALAAPEIKPEPGGFGEVRAHLLEVFGGSKRDLLKRLVTTLREGLAGSEIAVVVPGDGRVPVVLASYWSGDVPSVGGEILSELTRPGRYAVVDSPSGPCVAQPVVTPQRQLVAILLGRPAGAFGDEGALLLGEVARLLGLHWQEVERDDTVFSGWELEARHRLDVVFPGSSQAVQVLRAGVLAAAHGTEPVLICGAQGVGRTEVARVLATLGPVGGKRVLVFEGRAGDVDGVRAMLFGDQGVPTLTAEAGGVVGQAQGGVLIVRNADRLPETVQTELAAFISTQQSEQLSNRSIRWMVTVDEDPLALVQRGRLVAPLFMVLARRMLRVPRLAERREDLPLLIAGLMRRAAAEQGKTIRGITLECLNTLLARPFPGEMAELVGEINRLVTATPDGEMVRCEGIMSAQLIDDGGAVSDARLAEVISGDNLKEIVPTVEQHVIDRVMRRVKGNQSAGARLLGISRGALIAKLKEYGVPDYRYLRRRRSRGM